MKIHVLPGDALSETFQQTTLGGETLICRECLIEGEVKADSLEEFWEIRARFIEQTYGSERGQYFREVAGEFEKLLSRAQSGAEINLWYEYELFCQVNYWFTLFLLRESEAVIYRVAPVVRTENEIWEGFGNLSAADLEKCYQERVMLSDEDRARGANLWRAFQDADDAALERLQAEESPAFPFLPTVCRAAIDKKSRPQHVLQEIISNGKTDFAAEIFPAFTAAAGVYGFGDSQVKRILAESGKWKEGR